jgi:hypothetical protein
MRETLYIMSGVAVVLAWIVTRRHATHKPFAALLSLGLISDVALWALHRWVLPPPTLDGPPLTGWARIAGDVDSALFLAWPFAVAAQAMHTLAGRSYRPALGCYFVVMAVLIVGYPRIRGELLAQVFFVAELITAFIGVAAFIAFRRRGGAWNVTTLCTSIVVAGHLGVTIAGPYRFGLFGPAWALAQLGYVLINSVVIFLHVGSIWEAQNM